MDAIQSFVREFTSRDPRKFRFKIGHHLASSLSGFIAGAVFASIVWLAAFLINKILTSAY